MDRPVAYEGTEPYIFISYAHKDSDKVLPIVTALQEQGFRVWYDAGIEAGTEWPEYIAEHLEGCAMFLAFLSQASLDSPNCRREINFAIAEQKEMLSIYLEELHLSAGMRMQLGVLPAMFFYRHNSQESFLAELCRSQILDSCHDAMAPTIRKLDLDAISALFEYTQTDNGGIEIQKLKDKKKTAVEIPWGVDRIGDEAFRQCVKLTNITIPDSVTSIGEFAFYECKKLLSITIPDSVIHIGRQAFDKCTNLTCITIPDSVTDIEDFAFYGCENVIRVTIPDSVISIGPGAFSGCTHLTDITIPGSVADIGEITFSACKSLTHITLLHGVTSIGSRAFYNCANLTDITIPDSVTSIGKGAFENCSKLTSITIPDCVTSIGVDAFSLCQKLTTITIPDSVTSIGKGAFSCCFNLTIYGKRGSVAEQYAAENRISFQAI